ncbi:hypothetical protein PROFUN_10392 [Planoprotostelium fungivorum]|uniref:PB1 domain-containing protein n=1 Tax=Planoprotostelium fungivorum TaxID=1890364 RepID=A0A2P6NEE1_9EUKA|nr:hypothetical protein PROFUN_10392 [Planoprotostelium fungivorum]
MNFGFLLEEKISFKDTDIIMLTVKVTHKDQVRRSTIPVHTPYSEFKSRIGQLVGVKHELFNLQYEDDEGDLISLTNDEDLREAYNVGSKSTSLRLRTILLNDKPVNMAGGWGENVDRGVTSVLDSIPPAKLEQMIGRVLSAPQMQHTFLQTLLAAMPNVKTGMIPTDMIADSKAESKKVTPPPQPTQLPQPNAPVQTRPEPAPMATPPRTMYPAAQNFDSPALFGGLPAGPSIHNSGMMHSQNMMGSHNPSYYTMPPGLPYPIAGSMQSLHNSSNERLSANLVRDLSYPEGTKLPPRAPFLKTWRVQNTGNIPWPSTTRLVWDGGDTFGFKCESNPICLSPGQQGDVTIPLEAPANVGRITASWRLCSGNGEKFGPRMWCDVSVVDPSQMYPQLRESPIPVQQNHSENVSTQVSTSGGFSQGQGQVLKSGANFEGGLKQLEDMGFRDREANIRMMIQHNGEVLKVVQALLSQEGK